MPISLIPVWSLHTRRSASSQPHVVQLCSGRGWRCCCRRLQGDRSQPSTSLWAPPLRAKHNWCFEPLVKEESKADPGVNSPGSCTCCGTVGTEMVTGAWREESFKLEEKLHTRAAPTAGASRETDFAACCRMR